MVSYKKKVLHRCPDAVCTVSPYTKKTRCYYVRNKQGILAGGPTAVLAWKFSLIKLIGKSVDRVFGKRGVK